MNLALVSPHRRWRTSFLAGAEAFREEGLPWWAGALDFDHYVDAKLAEKATKTHLWAIANDTFVGRIAVIHELTDALRIEGGHIGYDTVPAFRGHGVATQMLRQALPVARGLGLHVVRLTCDDTNAASIRVIEKNGGQLIEIRSVQPGRPRKRLYDIPL
jgi:predicted acetyltransferase